MDETEQNLKLPDYVSKHRLEDRLGENQMFAMNKKYLLRDNRGKVVETPSEAVYRMASTMAGVENKYGANQERIEELTKDFYFMISDGYFSPAGRIWTNAGTEIKGLFNCYVLPVHDSMDRLEQGSIFNSVADAAVIHKNGGGTGYNFSELRPRGSYVKKSKGIASGPISFIGQFDKETDIINSGNRRGANMGILDITHPDILDFITAKSKRGKITNFNVSAGITDDFMKAVQNEGFYTLQFPFGNPLKYNVLEDMVMNIEENKLGGSDVGKKPDPASIKLASKKVILGQTEIIDSYNEKIAGRVDKNGDVQLSAPYVFNMIAELAHQTGDPGMIFLDAINRNNPLPKKGPIKSTNPCGEQPLHPYDACNLGSIILPKMVNDDGKKSSINFNKLEETVRTASRFMDDVNDVNKGPIPQIEQTVLNNRRIGLGVMGWADMLVKLRISYDSKQATDLAKKVMSFITDTAKDESVKLAKEKGVFPAFEESTYNTGNPKDRVRNLQRTTIAPTGTISMLYEVSSGIEPFYGMAFVKNTRGGDSLSYVNKLFQEELEKRGLDSDKILKLVAKNNGSVQGIKEIPKDIQNIFKTAHDLKYQDHINMQAAFQSVTDNAVSKTINMPGNATVEEVKKAYMLAWENNLKGITVYRDGSKDIQVLDIGGKKNGKLERKIIDILTEERPSNIIGRTEKVNTPYKNSAFVTLNRDVEETDPNKFYEMFINLGKAGGDLTAIAEGYGRLISMLAKIGVPPLYIAEQLEEIGGESQIGIGVNKVKSLPDSIAKGIKQALGIKNGNNKKGSSEEENNFSGNFCPDCGGPLAIEEGCQKCTDILCGFSKC